MGIGELAVVRERVEPRLATEDICHRAFRLYLCDPVTTRGALRCCCQWIENKKPLYRCCVRQASYRTDRLIGDSGLKNPSPSAKPRLE